MKTTKIFIVAAAVCASNLQAATLLNPGFLNSGEGWTSFGAAGFNEFFGPENPHASFFADNPGNSGGVFQTGIVATVGNIYTFALTDFLVEENFGGTIAVALEFYEADDMTLIAAESFSLAQLISDPTPAPGTFTITSTAPVGSVFVRPLISFANADGSGTSAENFFVFETSLTDVVPEPTTALFGVLGMAFFCLRRRVK